MANSPLHTSRLKYIPTLPAVINTSLAELSISFTGKSTSAVADVEKLKSIFLHTFGHPIAKVIKKKNENAARAKRIGVILSGGPAAGGHNVISGLFDALKKSNPKSQLIGFLGGPGGLVDNKKINITAAMIDKYRNTGGFDIIGSGRTKIETDEQFAAALRHVQANKLTALVVIGGDDSNTNAVLLAEYFIVHDCKVQVIGIPKTIDGDLKNNYVETSFGFDTATKTYAELIGNIARDANSSKKYWHFIRLMGRSASHITLECALQTQPNITIISEEVQEKKQSLTSIVTYIAKIIEQRSMAGEDFGVVLIPEGLIEFIPEIGTLIAALNDILQKNTDATLQEKRKLALTNLPPKLWQTFDSLPENIQRQLLLDRDAHGNVQVTLIETERMLIQMVEQYLNTSKTFKGKFNGQSHFFGYEARCAFPTNFDANYCYALGYNAYVLIANGLTGYLSCIRNLTAPVKAWEAYGIPLTMMMNIERRHGNDKPVIKKALVESTSHAFKYFLRNREKWAETTGYRYPASIQYSGDAAITDTTTITLQLETPQKKKHRL